MTNREKILKTNTYDLLVKMNDNLEKANKDGWYALCIIQALGLFDCDDRCHHIENCSACIQQWLNEEVHND